MRETTKVVPQVDDDTTKLFAAALDAWAEQLDDYPTEFGLLGLKAFENVNGFFPADPATARQFLMDLNDFLLSWPSADEIEAAEHEADAAVPRVEAGNAN